jgi:hypothetical protein
LNWTLPTIAGIQRVTAILTIVASIAMLAMVSKPAAIGCVAGGTVMIANLGLLVVAGRALVGLANGGGGPAVRIGVVLAPLKLLLLMVVVYLLIARTHIDAIGFLVGSLTQFVAIFIETGRVSMHLATAPSEDLGV